MSTLGDLPSENTQIERLDLPLPVITMTRGFADQPSHVRRLLLPKIVNSVDFEIAPSPDAKTNGEAFTVRMRRDQGEHTLSLEVEFPMSEDVVDDDYRRGILQALNSEISSYESFDLLKIDFSSRHPQNSLEGAHLQGILESMMGLFAYEVISNKPLFNMDIALFGMDEDSYSASVERVKYELKLKYQLDDEIFSLCDSAVDRVADSTNDKRLLQGLFLYAIAKTDGHLYKLMKDYEMRRLLRGFYELVVYGDDSKIGEMVKANLSGRFKFSFKIVSSGVPSDRFIGYTDLDGIRVNNTPVVLWEGDYVYVVSTNPKARWRIRIKLSDIYSFKLNKREPSLSEGTFSLDRVQESTVSFPSEPMIYEEHYLTH